MVDRTGLLFVCLGNICRSPMAEGVFLHLARQRGVEGHFRVDSAGTGAWHVGEPPDPRSRAAALRRGVTLSGRARRVDPDEDFHSESAFHWIIGMDRDNCAALIELGAPKERVRLLRSFDPALAGRPERELEVPDPYYGGESGFDEMYEMIHASCLGLLGALAPAGRAPGPPGVR